MEGDSGSLVFQPSLFPEEMVLDVLAIVQGKLVQNSQARVVCLPFKESCDNLKQNIPDLQNLQFFLITNRSVANVNSPRRHGAF